jgi:prefoldin subunit 5
MVTVQETPIVDEGQALEAQHSLFADCIGELGARFDHLEAMVTEYNQRIAALENLTKTPEIDINQFLLEALQALGQSGMQLNKMILEGQRDIAGLEVGWSLLTTPTGKAC